jgi:hypothetical protein
MKRLQVMIPDEIYHSLKSEAERREATVADIVRKGIDRVLEAAVKGPNRVPSISPCNLGLPLIPQDDWRVVANDRVET